MKEQNNIFVPDMISGPEVTWCDRILSGLSLIPIWIPLAFAVFTTCTVFIIRNVKQIDDASEVSMLTRTLLPEEESFLEGMYCVRSSGGDGGIYSSADVSSIEDSCFYVTVYSDYSPLHLEASLQSDGTLLCEGLGEGIVTYKPSTGSVNIIFTKEGKEVCEFLK